MRFDLLGRRREVVLFEQETGGWVGGRAVGHGHGQAGKRTEKRSRKKFPKDGRYMHLVVMDEDISEICE